MTSQPKPTAEDLQLAQELMAQLQDPEWVLAAAQLEEELDCDISAGPDLGSALGKMLEDPAGFYQHRRLKTIVFQELRQLLVDCDLGVGLSAAYEIGKPLLDRRLQQPAVEVQQQLMAILEEDLASSQDVPLSAAAQSSLRQVIQTVLSMDDWDVISAAATRSLQQHLKETVTLPQTV
ncbi:MAG: hypothetical protein AAFR25_06810 [Cyanobacteria bacterium J06629_19]